jgi:hypothetical protein
METIETKLKLLKLHPTYSRLYEVMIMLQEQHNNKYLFKNYECSLDKEFIDKLEHIRSEPQQLTIDETNHDTFNLTKRLQELLPASIFKQVIYDPESKIIDNPLLDLESFHSGDDVRSDDDINVESDDVSSDDESESSNLNTNVDTSLVDCCSVGKVKKRYKRNKGMDDEIDAEGDEGDEGTEVEGTEVEGLDDEFEDPEVGVEDVDDDVSDFSD